MKNETIGRFATKSGVNLSNKYVWIILVALALVGTVALSQYVPKTKTSADKEDRQWNAESREILVVFAEAHINAVRNVGDPAFVEYVAGPLQEICPFYIPDGVTYRDCLSDLVERGKATYGGSKSNVVSSENYCQSISDQYTGIETVNLYFSCMAYKLDAS
ncbi:MAG: hypothetical protein Q7S50_00070 [bacterium]|nr:hypothetical protein [bacterium]